MEILKYLSEKTGYNVISANSPSINCYWLLIKNNNNEYATAYYVLNQKMVITLKFNRNGNWFKKEPKFLKQINSVGGLRVGAGSKKKYSEPTETISFRCPKTKLVEMKKIISDKLSEWLPK